MKSHDIDIVLLWVDGSDPAWQQEFRHYLPKDAKDNDTSVNRYRDWDLMRYWFRGIDRFMPWVRKIHFVTWGHLPAWLDTTHPKLHVVNHRDFIPAEYLPLFNSRSIEIHLHRIPDLAEQFIYFNDDFFVLRPMRPTDYFHRGLPCDMAILFPAPAVRFGCSLLHDVEIINRHFRKRKVIKAHPWKWFHPAYREDLIYNICLLPTFSFHGFRCLHQPQSLLKSSFEAVWQAEPEALEQQSHVRYRAIYGINQYIFRYWQFMTGQFHPRYLKKRAALYDINDWSLPLIEEIIRKQQKQLLIINDSPDSPFEKAQPLLRAAFESILPEKSSFEKA